MIDYDGRQFRKAGDGDDTTALYRQDGHLVWANFRGGRVRHGAITYQ